MNEELLDGLIARQIDLMRFERSVRRDLWRQILALQSEVEARLRNTDTSALTRSQMVDLLTELDKLVDEYYWQMAEGVAEVQPQAAEDERDWLLLWLAGAGSLVGQSLSETQKGQMTAAAKRAEQRLTVGGLTVFEALAAQAHGLKTKLRQTVRVAAAELVSDSGKMLSDVGDVFKRKSHDLAAFSQTWIGSLANQVHFAVGKVNPWVKGWRHLSVLDGKTSGVCLNRHGKMWDKQGEPIGHDFAFKVPPVHINCRSKLVYVLDTDEPFNGISGDDWVKRRSLAQLQEQFGKGVGQMLHNGEISLSDAVKSGGLQPMSLQELQRKYPKRWEAIKQTQPLSKQAQKVKLAETQQADVVRKWMGEDLYRRVAGELENPRIKKQIKAYNMTQPEAVALRHYTGSGYLDLNAYLRGLLPEADYSEAVEVLNSALARLPDYQRVVIRRANLPPSVLQQHVLGSVVEYPAFTSATFGDKDVVINSYSPHRLKIDAVNAKRIDWISKYGKHESEVLFAAPTRFEVKGNPIMDSETGLLEIELEELP